MNVLVDTSVWSLAIRRQPKNLNPSQRAMILAWRNLVREDRACIIGPVRLEVLSGIPDDLQFQKLKVQLATFSDIPLEADDYERAAEMFNHCRRAGIQCSHIDMIICAAAERHSLLIFTTDPDFQHYVRVLGVRLLAI